MQSTLTKLGLPVMRNEQENFRVSGGSGRRVLVGPNHYAMVMAAGRKLDQMQPATALGQLAMQLSQQSTVSMISVAATTAYVYALTQASAPNLQFTTTPPGMTSSVSQLQGAYDSFLTQLNIFQGQAGAWVNTNPSSGAASILSQLVSVPTTLSELNGTVTSQFAILNAVPPGSQAYQSALTELEALIGAETPSITGLISAMQTLGTNLETATTSLIASTQTGVLSQLLVAYQADIAALNQAISDANSQISSDNSKIVGLGFAAAAAIVVGIIGLCNWWNPIGWILMGGGAVGAYFAIAEIEALKAQITELKNEINVDTYWVQQDQAAASLVSAFSTQLQGFASMNTASQQELQTLESLYGTLAADITAALTDLDNNQIAAAQAEWTEILAATQVLQGVAAYVWPSPAMLSSPSSFAALGSNVYSISLSGEMFYYNGSAWTDMTVSSLSCAGQGTTLVAIDGAPIDGTEVNPHPITPTYFVKSYNAATQAWTIISGFPAAAVAVGAGGNSAIYAINQTVSDRQVYLYSGTGTTWTALPQLPGPDAAIQIAVANNTLFALTNNSQFIYSYNGTAWTQLSTFTCASILANGNMLSIIGTDQKLYLYNAQTPGGVNQTYISANRVAQINNGDQYLITPTLDLYYIDNQVSPLTTTLLQSNVIAVMASDTNAVYYTDNLGDIYLLANLSTNSWTKLPAL